jgi:hypothetical protein
MNIIFKTNAPNIDEKYTVLDLDTFRLPDGSLHTACCVVENIPVVELPMTERLKELHANLIHNYGQRNWNYCEQAIEQLMGKWSGEVDSFYQELNTRIQKFKTQNLDDSWTGIIEKAIT